MKNKSIFKKVYLLSLIPLLSIAIYLISIAFCSDAILYFKEYGFQPEVYLALFLFLAMAVLWSYCGSRFSRAKVSIGLSVLIANAIPILTTAVFFVLYIMNEFNPSENLFAAAQLIGGLGTGTFGILGEIVFAFAHTISALLQVAISFAACIIFFMLGYAVGGPVARKDKQEIIKKMEQERLRKDQKKNTAKTNAKKK